LDQAAVGEMARLGGRARLEAFFFLILPLVFASKKKSKYTQHVNVDKWYGRTIYFLLVDRFALTDTDEAPQCGIFNATHYSGADVSHWCGGTIKGVIRKLDYIQGMGFDAIWITPVVLQVPWPSQYSSYGYDGYYAMDWYKIDPHFGTEQDLLDLGHELRKRSMLFMMDSVVNHAGPIWKLEQIKRMPPPFNDPDGKSFNQLWRKPYETFVQYLQHPNLGTFPVYDKLGKVLYDCHWPGDFFCGYNETVDHTAYRSFADINQSNADVKKYLLEWAPWMIRKYNIDGLRLDTVVDVDQWFIGEFQEAAGVFILGEVMVPANISYHAGFQDYVTGMTNMPIVYQWAKQIKRDYSSQRAKSEPFENDIWDVWQKKKTTFKHLQQTLEEQVKLYADVHLLGNFVDSHDTNRFLFKHYGDKHMLMNALVFVFIWHGIPIVYQGTENPQVSWQSSERAGMWFQSPLYQPYSNTDLYKFISALNKVRRELGMGHGGRDMKSLAQTIHADETLFVFKRGPAVIAISNGKNNSSPYLCMNMTLLPLEVQNGCSGHGVHVVFGDVDEPTCKHFPTPQLCIYMRGSSSAIYTQAPPPAVEHAPRDSLICLSLGAVAFTVMPLGFFAWGRRHPHRHRELVDSESSADSS